MSARAAGLVVQEYSTSFGLATRLMSADRRRDIRAVYALVRLADEVVDGALGPGVATAVVLGHLDRLEQETVAALQDGYSSNVLVHAFADTARRAAFGVELTDPFFASMRTDLTRSTHDDASFTAYVHGSAEVIGLMSLRVFLLDLPARDRERHYTELAPGAQALGSAFQKLNFLRDLADDHGRLGRAYLPGVMPGDLTEEQKHALLDSVTAELRLAAVATRRLPSSSRRAVEVAWALFAELGTRLASTPATEITRARVRVPGPVKARVVASTLRSGIGTGGGDR